MTDAPASGARQAVVLLHGLGRSPRSMRPVARALTTHGYLVFNLGYRSRSAKIRTLAESVARDVATIPSSRTLHFVTHSLGGVLLRVAVAYGNIPLARIGRVVMLGPPNGGSQIADVFNRGGILRNLYRAVMGPAGLELGVDSAGVIGTLPPLQFETGIIAGSRSVNPLLSLVLPGPNDGKVCVAQATAPGMRDFIVVPRSHPFLMRADVVLTQTIAFLETGAFVPEREPNPPARVTTPPDRERR
jgi:triacylglycerol lipase